MPVELIGNEALPNLYIKYIEILDKTVRIQVAFYDYKNEHTPTLLDLDRQATVFKEDFFSQNNINLNVVLCKEGSDLDSSINLNLAAQGIDNSEINAADYDDYHVWTFKNTMINQNKNNGSFTSSVSDVHRIIEKPINSANIRNKIENAFKEAEPGQYVEITEYFEFTFLNPIIHLDYLSCHAFFSYDIWRESANVFLDTEETPRHSKMLHGPIFSEIIIDNGDFTTTTMRKFIDGTPYSGPIHIHNGVAMEGSVHTEDQHRVVDTQIVKNNKISYLNPHSVYNKNLMKLCKFLMYLVDH